MHIIHKWEKWKTTKEGVLLRLTDSFGLPIQEKEDRAVIGYYIIQQSVCLECGKIRMREVCS
jgi:hypothetical protein